MDRSHRELVGAVERLAEADLAPGGKAAGLIDGIGAAHYREHAAQIAEWRARAVR